MDIGIYRKLKKIVRNYFILVLYQHVYFCLYETHKFLVRTCLRDEDDIFCQKIFEF